jgi:hypothetical protein
VHQYERQRLKHHMITQYFSVVVMLHLAPPTGRIAGVFAFPGLKPQAESFCPFGVESHPKDVS